MSGNLPAVDGLSDQDLLRLAVEFDLGEIGPWWNRGAFRSRVSIRKCEGFRLPEPIMWKIIDGYGYVLGKSGFWEREPQPSSRDDEFYGLYRYGSLAEAYGHAQLIGRLHADPQYDPCGPTGAGDRDAKSA